MTNSPRKTGNLNICWNFIALKHYLKLYYCKVVGTAFNLVFVLFLFAFAGQAIAEELTIAADGKANMVISVPAQPTPQERKSASELKLWLDKMTGMNFTIASEAPGAVISVGRTARFLQECGSENRKDLGKEGYGIAVKNGSLFLYGGSQRGPLYAVMSFLEDDLGCRWYTPQCTIIPHRPELKADISPRSYIPPFENREVYYFTAVNQDWALHNRSNPKWFKLPMEWGGSVIPPYNCYWNVHTLSNLLPNKPYFKTHPECFPMRNGKRVTMTNGKGPQPCLSNPKTTEIITANALKALEKNPQANFLSISENDSTNWCECLACQAELRAGYTRSDQMMRLVNAVAAKVRARYPKVTIGTLAYMDTYLPPHKVKPDPALRIQLCTDKHAFRWPHLSVDETKDFYSALKEWHRLGYQTYIWDYVVDFRDYFKPRANMEIVAKDIRIYLKNGVRGVMLQGAYQCPGGADAEMKSWVWTKLLWNPVLDWKKLQRDFVKGYYGSAAPEIQAYYDLLDSTWRKWHASPNRGDDMTFSESFITRAEKIFAAAEKAATKDPVILNRVKLAELPVIQLRLLAAGNSRKNVPVSEYPRYEQLLTKFAAIAKQNNVKRAGEQGKSAKLDKRLWELRSTIFGRKAVLDPNVMVAAEEFVTTLWVGAKIVPDSNAGNGYAAKQPPANTQWSVQWTPEGRYIGKPCLARVRMRFDMSGTGGNVLQAGVYNSGIQRLRMNKFFPAVANGKYAWYDLGNIELKDGDRFFFAPCNNSKVKAMFFDRLELIKNTVNKRK